ncbi:MAG: hypothetical protein GXO93_05315 [FCB group bacterium]|nr:hypothetical protein [FCB group bacterium]
MYKLISKIKNKGGTSLIEVMIALAITGVVTASIFKLYVVQHKNYMIQDDISDIQQNVRASIDELSKNIRMAGFDLPLGIEGIEAYNTNPDTIVILYQSSGCDTYLSDPMPQPSAELKCGSDVSCFHVDQWIYIYDADSAWGEWFQVSQVQQAALHIQHREASLSRAYDANALVLAMTRIKFYVDNTTDTAHPALMMQLQGQNPQVYAENISDLQFKYRMKSGQLLDVPDITENTREVQISITGHSNTPELADDGTQSYRYRTFSTSVYLRNIGI